MRNTTFPQRISRIFALLPLALPFVVSGQASAQAVCAAAWSPATAYNGSQLASLAGQNYTANWWTQGQSPATNSGGAGSGQPWTTAGVCSTTGSGTPPPPPPPPSSGTCFAAWSATATYTGGQDASLGNINYAAKWWTLGNNPSTNSGSGGVWSVLGTCSAATPPVTPPVTPPSTPPAGTTHLYAPYVDMSITADENLVAFQASANFKAVTLAFLDSANGCGVGWGGLGGALPTDSLPNGNTVLAIVQSLQTSGVQVILSFGGANGSEPALNCTSASQLQAVYQSAIDRYHVKMLDFDIEGGATTNQASITLRDKALVGLKAANSGLVVSYTLPVLPTGLIASGVNILQSAKSDGLALDVVNIMTMDYGSALDNGGAMGTDAVNAAIATEAQVVSAGLAATIGITPMIGVNDTNTEIFTLNDAQTVLNFANAHSYVSRLAIWSLGRDNGTCAGQTYASPSCSGVAQSAFQFTQNFNAY